MIKFGKRELKELLISIVILTIALAFALSDFMYNRDVPLLVLSLILAFFATITAFFLHELAHKITAQKYGCWAEYRMWSRGLMFALVFGFMGFLFAAPGAVYISGFVDKKISGRISIAGPITNICLGAIFITILLFVPLVSFLSMFFLFLAYINIWLGIFNLLPIPPLDGYKIMKWNIMIYIITMALAIAIFIILNIYL